VKFFIPEARTRAQAEFYWEGMRLILEDRGLPTEPRRIHSLWFRAAGEPRILQVGLHDSETGEPIVSIYRAANAPFYWVMTPSYGIMEGGPMPVAAEGTRAVDFDPDPPPRPRKPRAKKPRP